MRHILATIWMLIWILSAVTKGLSVAATGIYCGTRRQNITSQRITNHNPNHFA